MCRRATLGELNFQLGFSLVNRSRENDSTSLAVSSRCSVGAFGHAAEAVLRGNPTLEEANLLYRLVKRNGGKHLSRDVFMALLEAERHVVGIGKDKRGHERDPLFR